MKKAVMRHTHARTFWTRLALLLSPAAIGVALLVLSLSFARADEGMWTFDNFPVVAVNQALGTKIDRAWLDHVQLAAVRLSSGCSASLVTTHGLILTNHHCVRDCAQQLSTAGRDYVKDGFQAGRREDERLCPGMIAEVLISISDVTSQVTAAAAGKTGQSFVKARDAAIAQAEKAGCAGKEDRYRCQVITLYQGGQYKLYTYRKYTDVRLVFAPEGDTAFFGGDPDNFNFPRYDLDCSFVRIYENGKPVTTPDHLIWTSQAPKEGEATFIAGNPGSTQRLLTVAQLETLRDLSLPEILILFSELRGRLLQFSAETPEHARIASDLLFGVENSFKAYRGEEKALVDPALIVAKRTAEADLRQKIAANPALAGQTGDPWSDITQAEVRLKALYFSYGMMESRAGLGSDLFHFARALVRSAEERAKPNSERLPEYTDSRLPLLAKAILDPQPVYPELEQLVLTFWLSKLRENLTADGEGTKVFLGKDSPETLAARLATSHLSDPAVRKALWDGGLEAIKASNDPMIKFVLATDAASRAIRTRYENEVSGVVDRASQQIAKARFAIYGTSVYPDATFSLRLSYGKVRGWSENGTTVPATTHFGGLYERATGQYPFALTQKWITAKDTLDPRTVFDFVTDNDIVGGNSGSPIIDAKGAVIGAAFDGNIDSLGGAFGFDARVNRSVGVSTAAITEALRKVYHDDALVAELTGNG
ncbi:MAG TPA: S46 family peptidase [Rhizomicrobium sp.]|nr:S46 family peptidase [Rhizomicrobium sp.]